MAKEIYRSRDESGADFAFDAAGEHINWTPVVKAAKDGAVRLEFRLSMLSTRRGIVSSAASVRLTVPKGSKLQDVKNRAYAAIRAYSKNVYARAMKERESEEYDEDEIGDEFDYESDYENSVTLLSGVSIR